MSARYYLYCRRGPDPEAGRGREAWFYGEVLKGRNVTGKPQYLDERTARWMGPRLAKECACEVAVMTPSAGDARVYDTLGRWRYNPMSGDVETISEWGDTSTTGGGSACAGVSRGPQESGPG